MVSFLLKLNFHHFHLICNFSISRAPPSSDKLINCLANPLLLRWENTQSSILITTFWTSCHLGYSQKKNLLIMIFWISHHLRYSQRKAFSSEFFFDILTMIFMASYLFGYAFSKTSLVTIFFMASCHLGYPQESTTSLWALAESLCQPTPTCQRMIPYKPSYLKGINAEL